MCVQFMIQSSAKELVTRYGAKAESDFSFKPHVFPRYVAPVLGMREGGRVLKPYFFGLIPAFEKNEKPKMVFHNARVETVHEKPSFKSSFLRQRCLVPMDSFFEYIWETDTQKWVARFFPKDEQPMTAAGIYSTWISPLGERLPTFSLITKPAPPFIHGVGHDRSPCFLRESHFDAWISEGVRPVSDLHRILIEGEAQLDFDFERMA